ncbi:hypothetical protein Ahy_B04g071802 [Arachis hypogaea]|uniref:Uncharacterized protein n=1 Tax=Arachis hypogaea TaxID=3818 RepID=A0A444ZLM7_ARAHY|nr:hypothetical protein Ahy_B04g071802 [Arachis hypogaea]
MKAEIDGHMTLVKKAKTKKKLKELKEKEKKEKKRRRQVHPRVIHRRVNLIFPLSLSLKKTQRNQEGNNPPEWPKSKMESRKRKQILEDSTLESESESNDETQSKKRKYIVEDSSSEEQIQSYDGMKGAGLQSTECHYDSSKTLSLEEELVSDPGQQKMIIVRMETHSQSESLSITPQPQKLDESPPTVPPAPFKVNPASEITVALMMMARTASYIPKEFPMSSFSLGFTDSSQEETL